MTQRRRALPGNTRMDWESSGGPVVGERTPAPPKMAALINKLGLKDLSEHREAEAPPSP